MKRLKTINLENKLEVSEYKLPTYKSGDYVVDDSCFVPMSEAVRQLAAGNTNGVNDDLLYDFPNGKDNGKPVPITRSKNCKDIAEISSAIMEDINNVTEKMSEARAEALRKSEFEAKLNSIKPAADTPSGQ